MAYGDHDRGNEQHLLSGPGYWQAARFVRCKKPQIMFFDIFLLICVPCPWGTVIDHLMNDGVRIQRHAVIRRRVVLVQ